MASTGPCGEAGICVPPPRGRVPVASGDAGRLPEIPAGGSLCASVRCLCRVQRQNSVSSPTLLPPNLTVQGEGLACALSPPSGVCRVTGRAAACRGGRHGPRLGVPAQGASAKQTDLQISAVGAGSPEEAALTAWGWQKVPRQPVGAVGSPLTPSCPRGPSGCRGRPDSHRPRHWPARGLGQSLPHVIPPAWRGRRPRGDGRRRGEKSCAEACIADRLHTCPCM